MIAALEGISKDYHGNSVLKNVSLTIENQDRIGLIGVNGCGKSTLLKILTGKEFPDEGTVSVTNGMTMGILEQNTGLDRSSTILEEMRSVFSELTDISRRLRELEEEMSAISSHDSEEYRKIAAEYAEKSAYFEAREGYNTDIKIRTVLNGMGFPKEWDDRVISTLSGGEKTRLALAKLLLENPSLLILDEPTNHLDFDTILWLEDYLQTYSGALLIVSHDRYFLDRLVTSVAEIERGRLCRYKGNYSAFTVQKEMALERQWKEYLAQQEEISKLQEYIDKNMARASTAKSARSRVNTLEKMELIEKPLSPLKDASIQFTFEIDPPKDLLTVEGVDITAGTGDEEKKLISDCSFEIKRGEKIAVVGANGIGKSTLLKTIQNIIPHKTGTIRWAKNIKISYFEQENAQLNKNLTVLEELHRRFPAMTEESLRSLLGRVRLVGENVFKPVSVISGGERAKLCFAIIMLEHANVLILDEPTNHLDLSTKEALEKALQDFPGTILFVSHDRYLLKKIATGILELTPDHAEVFPGGFENYLEERRKRDAALRLEEELKAQEKQKAKAAEKNVKVYRSREQRNADVQRKRKLKELEENIDRLQNELESLENQLSSPEIQADYQEMNRICLMIDEMKNQISADTDQWLLLSEEM